MSENASITVDETPNAAVTLRLTGELTAFHANELQSEACRLLRECGDFHVECRDLRSIDLAVGQILLALQIGLNAEGRRFDILNASPELSESFKLVGLPCGGKVIASTELHDENATASPLQAVETPTEIVVSGAL